MGNSVKYSWRFDLQRLLFFRECMLANAVWVRIYSSQCALPYIMCSNIGETD